MSQRDSRPLAAPTQPAGDAPLAPERGSAGGPQRARSSKALALQQRRYRVCELYMQGRYQHEIARALGVSVKTVSRDLEHVERIWLAAAVTNFDKMRADELARINHLERTYWRAWRRSLESREESSSSKTTAADGETTAKAEIKRRRGEGNPAFLAGVQWCVERRCKLFGLDRPGGATTSGVIVINGVDMKVALGREPHPDPLMRMEEANARDESHNRPVGELAEINISIETNTNDETNISTNVNAEG